MKIPYNCLHTHGSVLFAARGGKIHTFGLSDGAHIATWKHPELDAFLAAGTKATARDAEKELQGDTASAEADDSAMVDEVEPPAKRQKVTEDGQNDTKGGGKSNGSSKGKSKDQRKPRPIPVPDRPVMIQLTTSVDGNHLVAVSGHDKAVWVFAHDGQGHLRELSKRIMPKRPSSIKMSSDDQIICADKFGDVYAVPLIKSTEPYLASQKPAVVAKPLQRPAATVLTVHSKGNRAALAAQQRQLENPTNTNNAGSVKVEGPDFAHTLLLGHVSMLTALLLAEDGQGRKYIITSDRDEHIRVSRYMPQAHIIHGYCLGHKEFVGDMVIPSRRKDILVSGGGDEDVFVWDWLNSKLLSKANILNVAKEVAPQASHVAVSRVITLEYPSENGPQTHVLAVCEGISAIFTWQLLDDNTLTRPGVIQLPGKPLDIAVSEGASLSVALHIPEDADAAAARSLHNISLTIDDGRLAVDTLTPAQDEAQEAEEQDVAEADVRTLFYTVEHLRKQQASGAEEAEADGGEQPEGVGAEEEA